MGFIVMTVESKLKERLLARGPFKSATSIAPNYDAGGLIPTMFWPWSI